MAKDEEDNEEIKEEVAEENNNEEKSIEVEEDPEQTDEENADENCDNVMKDCVKGVINSEISEEARKAYLDYAMSVIVSRAIPAVEDGMKPVQRRILHSMNLMGLKPNTQTKKSARIVGDVIGKYHPHGDVAVYESMVRMAQSFSLRYPLVYGQGNFGSIDGDPPAAYRYTEAKMKDVAMELMEDIDKETVKFVPNFDNSLKEPELLPGKLPALLLNGATGIAVGMATNIPSHNLTEVCDGIIALVKNPEITIEELVKIIPGPDFPTGGSISGDMLEIYKNGYGKIIMRGKTTTETTKNRESVIITEIPYMLNKTTLIEDIARLVQEKKLKDVSDLRDESAKGKIRIVLEMKKDADPKYLINSLYKFTRLQDSFGVNMLALVKGQPRVLNLKQFIEEYVRHRKTIITNRSKFDLKKAKDRLELVEGLLIALKQIDAIIDLIKKSKSGFEASEGLMHKFGLTKRQAQAVLETKLQQLTSMEVDKLKAEEQELKLKIAELEKILGDINEVLKIIVKEVQELKRKYGDNRKTNILQRIRDIDEKDLVQDKEVVITITDKGYCKRMDVQAYKEQKRGGKGAIGNNLATGDFTKQLIYCSTHDYLMFFTSRGRVLWLKAYDIPFAEKYSKGKAIVNLLNLTNEIVTNVLSVKNFDDFLFMVTKKGVVKKISLKYFSNPRASGIRAISLPEDNSDSLVGVEIIKKAQEVLIATKEGQAIRFNEDEVRDMGRASYGVTGIKMDGKDEVVSLEVLTTSAILTITKRGYGKRTAVEDYRKTGRAGKGVINMKVTDKTGEVIKTVSVNDEDSIIVSTAKGIVIRTSLDNIRVMGRATQGVRIVKLQDGDYVSDLLRVMDAEEVEGLAKAEIEASDGD